MESTNDNTTLPALNFTPPAITFDYEALNARITAITEQYKGLLVQESDIPAIKSELAGLNKLKAGLSAARKEAVAKISVPIKEFEKRILALEEQISTTRTMLDEQVKVFVKADQEARRAGVQFIIDSLKESMECPDIEIPIKQSWLMASVLQKTVNAEISAIIAAHQLAKAKSREAEAARAERAEKIEVFVRKMNDETKLDFNISQFLTAKNLNLEEDLEGVLREITSYYIKTVAERTARQEALANAAPPQVIEPPAVVKSGTQEVAPRVKRRMIIKAEYYAENGAEINKFYKLIKSLCVECAVNVSDVNKVPF
jgi:hypothetical protein